MQNLVNKNNRISNLLLDLIVHVVVSIVVGRVLLLLAVIAGLCCRSGVAATVLGGPRVPAAAAVFCAQRICLGLFLRCRRRGCGSAVTFVSSHARFILSSVRPQLRSSDARFIPSSLHPKLGSFQARA